MDDDVKSVSEMSITWDSIVRRLQIAKIDFLDKLVL
jgi:hypothetical protein